MVVTLVIVINGKWRQRPCGGVAVKIVSVIVAVPVTSKETWPQYDASWVSCGALVEIGCPDYEAYPPQPTETEGTGEVNAKGPQQLVMTARV